MREIKREIQISAPIDKVWQVLTDFENWKDWNTTAKAKGNTSLGTKLSITMIGEDCKEKTYGPEVVEVDAPKVFRWQVKMMGGLMFTNERVFELHEKNGGTEFVNIEKFSGLMASIFGGKMEAFIPPNLEKMNLALKNKVESLG